MANSWFVNANLVLEVSEIDLCSVNSLSLMESAGMARDCMDFYYRCTVSTVFYSLIANLRQKIKLATWIFSLNYISPYTRLWDLVKGSKPSSTQISIILLDLGLNLMQLSKLLINKITFSL